MPTTPPLSHRKTLRRARSARKTVSTKVSYFTDEGSKLARAFGVLRTPQVYVFDQNDNLVYSGGIDDSPGDAASVQQTSLKDALDAMVEGGEIQTPQTEAFGCTIKPVEATG